MLILRKGSVSKVRYLIKFTKEGNIKFISHLDLMRTIQRIIRRAGLPIDYSKGFNPHMALSLAQPLSVGVSSSGEYMDIVLVEDMDKEEVLSRLNENLPIGIKFIEATKIPQIENVKRVPQAMALIDAARYTIKIKCLDAKRMEESLGELLSKEEFITLKKSKKGEKSVDIKPMIHEIKYWINDDYLVINTLISSGSREHLSPDLLSNYIKENTIGANMEAFVAINREEMYAYKDEKLVPLYKYIQ